MKYLVSVKDTLTTEEMGKLKHTNAFPLEQPAAKDGSKPEIIRQKPMQLYEPVEAMRNLGLPILDWGEGKWKPGSEEARMLFSLGLRRYPPLDVLLGLAAGSSRTNQRALEYLLANIQSHYLGFNPKMFENVAFLPATLPDGKQVLAKPGEVSLAYCMDLMIRYTQIGPALSSDLPLPIRQSHHPTLPTSYDYRAIPPWISLSRPT